MYKPALDRRILQIWWPLAASWLLMAAEGPALSAIMARLAHPEINLAAYGGLVNPLALIIEAPIIMLLSASTALSKDQASYQKVYRFMMRSGAILTVLHALVAFTPLYDFIAVRILGVPVEIIEPGRAGLQVMLPWTWAIAYRRFQQGVMIRFGHSRAVGAGTIVRLSADGLVLAVGYMLGAPGVLVAAGAQTFGVVCEAAFAAWRVQPILRHELRLAPPVEPLSWRQFFAFYTPLALTSLLSLIWQPIGSAALSRMPFPLESLAVFPVLSGLIFVLRSPGYALNEVVVALMDEPGAYRHLKRFTARMSAVLTLIILLMAATPIAHIWFSQISALQPALAALAIVGLWISTPLPGLTVLQSWFQGAILYGRTTRGIPESIVAFMVTMLIVLGIGVSLPRITGLYIGMAGLTLASTAQTGWLWFRSRPVMQQVRQRDKPDGEPEAVGERLS